MVNYLGAEPYQIGKQLVVDNVIAGNLIAPTWIHIFITKFKSGKLGKSSFLMLVVKR